MRTLPKAEFSLISIHAPREGSDFPCRCNKVVGQVISIHAPREGSDPAGAHQDGAGQLIFLSTLPARGATVIAIVCPCFLVPISIHAPREGSDRSARPTVPSRFHFYPRSPRGERPSMQTSRHRGRIFLSTLPARGATFPHQRMFAICHISIHAPREGSDFGRRLFAVRCVISIHAPREGSDSA